MSSRFQVCKRWHQLTQLLTRLTAAELSADRQDFSVHTAGTVTGFVPNAEAFTSIPIKYLIIFLSLPLLQMVFAGVEVIPGSGVGSRVVGAIGDQTMISILPSSFSVDQDL